MMSYGVRKSKILSYSTPELVTGLLSIDTASTGNTVTAYRLSEEAGAADVLYKSYSLKKSSSMILS